MVDIGNVRIDEVDYLIRLPLKDYYLTSDKYCYMIYKDLNKEPKQALKGLDKDELYKQFEIIGYYGTIESALLGLRNEALRKFVSKPKKKTMKDLGRYIDEINKLIQEFDIEHKYKLKG